MADLMIKKIINSEFASDNEQGNLIFDKINKLVNDKNNEEIYLDFSELKIITTAFLNNAIGKLYKKYSVDDLKDRLKIKNLKDKSDLELLRLVILNAIDMSK